MLNKIYGNMDVLTSALNGSSYKNEIISNNLANVNTPGYKKSTVNFESELRDIINKKNVKLSLNKTNDKHRGVGSSTLQNFKPTANVHETISTRRDKNNVNPDIEMVEMAKNTIMYNALVDQISRKFSKIQSVITEGGK